MDFLVGGAGLIVALLRSVLYEELVHDWSMVPPYAAELIVLLTWFCFYRIWQGKSLSFYLPILGFLFGFYTSVYSILFPFYFVFIFLYIYKKIRLSKKVLLKSAFWFFVPILPLIIFEFRYDFIQLKRLLMILDSPPTASENLHSGYFLYYNFKEIVRILNFDLIPKILLLPIFAYLIFYFAKSKFGFWKEDFHKILLFGTYTISILSFTFLPTHVSDNYFLALSTITLLYIGGMLKLFSQGKFARIFVVLILANIVFLILSCLG